MQVRVRVKTGANKEVFTSREGGVFEIAVREKPIDDAANHRVIALIAEHFHVTKSEVAIVRGHRERTKTLRIPDARS